MKIADHQARVAVATAALDQRWVAAARRVGAPMPAWLAPVSGVGLTTGAAALATVLPKPLRKMALSSVLPLLLSRVFR